MFNTIKHLTLQNKQFFLLKNSLVYQYHNLCNVSKYISRKIPEEKFSFDFHRKLNSGRNRKFPHEN